MSIRPGRLILLDTNILVDLVRHSERGRRINEQFQLTERADRPLFSSVTEGEILGLARLPKWRWGEAKLRRLQQLLGSLVRVDAGLPEVVDAYAELYAASHATGHPTGDNDLWIAATAKATGSVLLTRDSDFDWMSPGPVEVERITEDR